MNISGSRTYRTNNASVQQQDQDFTINSGENIPVYNALKAAYEPATSDRHDFSKQFQLPEPDIIEPQTNLHIFLPDYTCIQKTSQPLSIFNPDANFREKINQQQKKVKKNIQTDQVPEGPHSFNSIHGAITKNTTAESPFAFLKPVPLVKLSKQQESYTKEINQIVQYSPVSKGSFQSTDAMMGILIGFILFFLYLRTVFARHVRLFLKSAFNRVRAENLLSESNIIVGRVSFLLNLFYFFVLGLLFTHLADYYGYNIHEMKQLQTFATLSGIVIALYLLKWIAGWILAHFLHIQQETKDYLFHAFVFNKAYSIIVFPFLLAIPYINSQWGLIVLKGAFILFGLFYLLRFFRNLNISIQRNVSVFYMFLYLCALEIIPILVIVKLAAEWLQLPFF